MTDNERIAVEIMGWVKLDRVARGWGKGPDVYSTGESTEGVGSNPTYQGPEFNSDLDECHMMEEKIQERGWDVEYCDELRRVICGANRAPTEGKLVFLLIHATPAQRVTAAIRMLDGMEGEK